MSKAYKISDLIMNHETPYYEYSKKLEDYNKIKKVNTGNSTRYLTWIDDKNIESITTPEGRELTPEELFNFIIGDNITDFARTKNRNELKADIAIVLGNVTLPTTRERAIKAFELYKLGIVKKIIFTGGISKSRDVKGIYHPKTIEEYMSNEPITNIEWQDLPEAYWGAETFIPDVFHENFENHLSILTEDFLKNIGINPEDVMSEAMSSNTQENAKFCKNIFDSEQILTGLKIDSAILVTTCTHGGRALRQFKKIFRDSIHLTWCPSTLDLEKYETIKNILRAPEFDEDAFRKEFKRVYCTNTNLIKHLMEETAHHRNAFILDYIDEPSITTIDKEKNDDDFSR